MRNIKTATICVVALLALSVAQGEGGQQVIINGTTSELPVQLPGMGPRQPKTGTARMRGRAVTADTGAPVRRAVIRISGPDIGTKTAFTDVQDLGAVAWRR